MEDRDLIEIPLDDRDAKLLPPLYEYFKSFWSDTSQEPRAHYNTYSQHADRRCGISSFITRHSPLAVIGLQNMKRFILVLGILLMLAGAVGLIHPRFTYNKTEEVAKIGPMQANVTHEEIIEIPIAVSILLLVSGIGLAVFGGKAKS